MVAKKGGGRKGGTGGGGPSNPFGPVTSMAIGALIFIAILMFGPYLAGTIQLSTPALGVTNSFNATYRSAYNLTALPDPSTTWTTIVGLLTLCAVVVVFTVAFAYFKGML